jgi:hypothetical protein
MMDSGGRSEDGDGFDEDGFGEFLAEAESGVTDLADHHLLLAEQPDLLIFAETEFPEAPGEFRGCEQLADAADGAWLDLVERADEGVQAFLDRIADFG